MKIALMFLICVVSGCATVKIPFIVKSGEPAKIYVDNVEVCKETPCRIDLICEVGAMSGKEAITNRMRNITAVSILGGEESVEVNACNEPNDEEMFFFLTAGPVYRDMTTNEYTEKFMNTVCNLSVAKKSTYKKQVLRVCSNKWASTFLARVGVEYSYADISFIKQKCEAYPMECSLEKMELWAIKSHRINQASAKLNKAIQARQTAQFDQLINSINSLKTPVNCTSSANGMGGFSTTCN